MVEGSVGRGGGQLCTVIDTLSMKQAGKNRKEFNVAASLDFVCLAKSEIK
jgi:hypothetical protein